MPENNKTELFLESLAAVSRMNFQIWDSKASLRFTTRRQGCDDSAKSGCLKCAKEIILSGAFVYAPHGENRCVCGLPMPLENGTTGALLTIGPLPEADADSAHPRLMEMFLKQIAMREAQTTVDVPQAPQHVNEHPNPRFEDLYLSSAQTDVQIRQPGHAPDIGPLLHHQRFP